MWDFLFFVPKQLTWLSHPGEVRKAPKENYCHCAQLTICFMYFFPCCQINTEILWSELTPHKSLNFQHMNTLLMESTKVKSRRGTNYLDCKDDSLLFFSFLFFVSSFCGELGWNFQCDIWNRNWSSGCLIDTTEVTRIDRSEFLISDF